MCVGKLRQLGKEARVVRLARNYRQPELCGPIAAPDGLAARSSSLNLMLLPLSQT
jgi:hypothetical protein